MGAAEGLIGTLVLLAVCVPAMLVPAAVAMYGVAFVDKVSLVLYVAKALVLAPFRKG